VAIDESVHENRARAESFGSVADQYDRYRPTYPDALISDLLALGPDWTLDIACGTGKVAVSLLACGLAVLGVEVDPDMAAVARRHGIIVEIASFETWDDGGRTFDLITCGQGWHWIDPDKGPAKAAALLNPSGTLALFWNYGELDGELKRELDEVYQSIAPELSADAVKHRHDDEPWVEHLKSTGRFDSVRTETYDWSATLDTEEWVARVATHSDHITLPADRRAKLFDAIRVVIDKHGGQVTLRSGTYAVFARVPEK
jgi:SAM-dependent methyltransferase